MMEQQAKSSAMERLIRFSHKQEIVSDFKQSLHRLLSEGYDKEQVLDIVEKEYTEYCIKDVIE